nr:MAG TPA: helix-turn-helix domain protein [Caudoviricetes sp.]
MCGLHKKEVLRLSEVTKRIDNVLREKGISKKDFYEACDITSSAYSQWNTGKTEPRTAKLKEISNYLNIMYEWLAFGVGKKEKAPTPEGEREITMDDFTYAFYKESRDLPDEKKKMLLDMARFMKSDIEKGKG